MTRIFEAQEFVGFYDRSSGKTFSDLEFRRCRFVSSDISMTAKPRRRSTVRNVRLLDCEEAGCAVSTAIIEDVLVDGLRTRGTLLIHGAVFKHVTLRGKIGRIMISATAGGGIPRAAEQRAFDEANAVYYAGVDWALDIREGIFEDVDLRGVPGKLILRDPETQVLITRAKAVEGQWRQLDLSKTYWPTLLDIFLQDTKYDSTVLAVPKRMSRTGSWTYEDLLNGLRLLREHGVAEPD